MRSVAEIVCFDPAAGLTPEATTPPWSVFYGVPLSSIDPTTQMLDIVTETDAGVYAHVFPKSVGVTDDMECQLAAQVVDGTSPVFIGMSDGGLPCMMYAGTSVVLDFDAYTVTALAVFDATIPHVYCLRKCGTERWILLIDDVVVCVVPYVPVSPFADAQIVFGQAGAGTSRWSLVECSVNLHLAPTSKLLRWRNSLPVSMLDAFGDGRTPAALARTILGAFEGWEREMIAYPRARTSGAVTVQDYTATGEVLPAEWTTSPTLPDDLNALWYLGSDPLELVRERIRVPLDAVASTTVRDLFGFFEDIPHPSPHLSMSLDLAVIGDVNRAPPNGSFGLQLIVSHSDGLAVASLSYDSTTETFYWVMGSEPLTWTLDPFQTHRIELHLFVNHGALLIIDGVPRISQKWSDLAGPGAMFAVIRVTTDATHHAAIDVANVRVQAQVHDLHRRPALLDRAAEAGVPLGGCERNDLIEVLVRHQHGLHAFRGTDHGIRFELRRLTCGPVSVYTDRQPASWFLNVSWPGITPTWLNAPGDYTRIVYAVGTGSRNFTAARLGAWVAYHLLPRSVGGILYEVAIQVETTGAFSSGTAAFATDPKVPFAIKVGDLVQVRDPAGLHPITRRVTAISSSSVSVTPSPDATLYATGSIVLRTIGRS